MIHENLKSLAVIKFFIYSGCEKLAEVKSKPFVHDTVNIDLRKNFLYNTPKFG